METKNDNSKYLVLSNGKLQYMPSIEVANDYSHLEGFIAWLNTQGYVASASDTDQTFYKGKLSHYGIADDLHITYRNETR